MEYKIVQKIKNNEDFKVHKNLEVIQEGRAFEK